MPLLLALSHQNHQHSLRSSSVILIFWPLYLFSIAITLRTLINIIALGQQPTSGGFARGGALGWTAEGMYLASIGCGIVAWLIECYGPENRGITLRDEVTYDKAPALTVTAAGRKPSRRSLGRVRSSSTGSVRGNGHKHGHAPVFADEGDIPQEVDEDRQDGEGMEDKVAMKDYESPVLRANIYNRLTFGWLTRESPGVSCKGSLG